MNMSGNYGTPDQSESERVLLRALELGYTFFDTATIYGFGHNESLVGRVLKAHRNEYVLASKCGLFRNDRGKREINGHPAVLKRHCEESLHRLQTDVIDLYYLHRQDPNVPIEDSVGALADLVSAGKIRTVGLSEVGPALIRRAHSVHPITAVQSEYSLWTRNPENGVLNTCEELGIGFVPFSPLARGFLTGKLHDVSVFEEGDLRRTMPRFQPDNYAANLKLLNEYEAIAKDNACTMAQLALAWILARHNRALVPIPGTKHVTYLEENAGAGAVDLGPSDLERLDRLINADTVSGERYPEAMRPPMDNERG